MIPILFSEFTKIGEEVGITTVAHDLNLNANEIRYSLENDANGIFKIDPLSGIVSVSNPSLIDFEKSESHVIEVKATGFDNSTFFKNFTINIENVEDETMSEIDPNADYENWIFKIYGIIFQLD